MRRLTGLLGSIGDAGASAAGSFLVGLIALRALDTAQLALYGLLFSAGVAAMIIPQQMGYMPRRLRANSARDLVRPSYRSDVWGNIGYILIASAGVALAGLPLSTSVGLPAYLALSITAATWVAASSFQDHVRTSLHITGDHLKASLVSTTQLALAAAAFATVLSNAHSLDSIAAFLPFGVLTLVNLSSAAVGIILHRSRPVVEGDSHVKVFTSIKIAASAFVIFGGTYLLNLAVAAILGSHALASLESVRIAAQPVMVAATALASFLLPGAIRLQQNGHREQARRRLGLMVTCQVAVGAGYSLLVPLVAGPLSSLASRPIPGGLASAQSMAFAMQATVSPVNQLNVAAGHYLRATVASALSVICALVTLISLISSLQLYAVPIALAVGAIVRAMAILISTRMGNP